MRQCGECTLCCTVTRVPELSKPEREPCPNCGDSGCSIYRERPESCRGFTCEWLLGALGEEDRPDKLHAVIEKLPNVPVVLALVEPGHGHILPKLKPKLAAYTENGVSVVASNGLAILPEGTDYETVRNQVISAAKYLGACR